MTDWTDTYYQFTQQLYGRNILTVPVDEFTKGWTDHQFRFELKRLIRAYRAACQMTDINDKINEEDYFYKNAKEDE